MHGTRAIKASRRQVPLFHLPIKIANNYFVLLEFIVESPEYNAVLLSLFPLLWIYNPSQYNMDGFVNQHLDHS